MWVGLLRAELRIPQSGSLKGKRSVVKSLLARLQQRFGCACAEVEHQDLHQRAAIGIALVAPDRQYLRTRLDDIRRVLQTLPEAALLDLQEETLRGPEPYGQEGLQSLLDEME